eukprot:TRINITY_DN469_c0_g1_i1.p1 TRINITY_DN469_c0_g1~~TRINITY_DN469_c0_g1_i1.p1  ORF type:complete len:1067 (+),score=129.49 TRINITY_DN469_c0_g1_i1:6554-9754(+)
MASNQPTLSFSSSGGEVSATGAFLRSLLPDSFTSARAVLIASISECSALGSQTSSQLLRYLAECGAHPPAFLASTQIEATVHQPHTQRATLFWPHAQHARARVALPRTTFHLLFTPSRQFTHTPVERAPQLYSCLDVDRLLRLATTAATLSPQYASVVDDLYDVAALIQKTYTAKHVRRQLVFIRMIAAARLNSRDHRVLSQAHLLVDLDPNVASSYLYRAQARCAAKEFWLSLLDIWYALLVLDVSRPSNCRVLSLFTRCLPQVPYIGLDVLFLPSDASIQHVFPVPYDSLMWDRLSPVQQMKHTETINDVRSRISEKSLLLPDCTDTHMFASNYEVYSWPSPNSQTSATAVKLPRMFKWLIPLRLAGSANLFSRAHIAAIKNVGFTLVVSLAIERRLESSWFDDSCRNLFLPIRKHGSPSFHQIDVFIAQAADAAMTLVHSSEGGGRTGLLMTVWLMLFGYSSGPSLCSKCSSTTCADAKNKFVGCCDNANCALALREPKMSAQEAVEMVRSQRDGLTMSNQQEHFLEAYHRELWRRHALLHNVDQHSNRYEMIYFPRMTMTENDTELHTIGRPLKKFPSLIVLCGLPGSGKSCLAERIASMNKSRFIVASQDALGSRDSCVSCVCKAAKKCSVCPIVDRCNPMLSDRLEWLRCAFSPSAAIIVHMDISQELCISRAERRTSHPTLIPNSAAGVIRRVRDSFQNPDEQDLHAGYECVYTVFGRASIETFVEHIGRLLSSDHEDKRRVRAQPSYLGQTEEKLANCSGATIKFTPEQGVTSNECVHNDHCANALKVAKTFGNTDSSSKIKCEVDIAGGERQRAGPIRLPGFVKYPRTRHILNLGGGVTDDDLVMNGRELTEISTMLNTAQFDECTVLTIEEKVDGANLGFSMCANSGSILIQNRSHYVNTKSHPQFKLVKFFVDTYEEDLRKVLRGGERILYGEWMYAKHSIHYTKLPSVFLAFDLFVVAENKFMSRSEFRRELKDTKICCVREVQLPGELTVLSIKNMALNCESLYYDGPAEGMYIRIDRQGWLVDRAKIVRPDFIAGDEHWTKREPERNRFESL